MIRDLAAIHRDLAAKEPCADVAAAHIRFAEKYESKTAGSRWADRRLGQAYDLIDAVLRENVNTETDLDQFLRKALVVVEEADMELERLIAPDRASEKVGAQP